MIKRNTVPPTWLIILMIGVPLFSETAYIPSLPDIAQTLSVPDALVEYTLTIYMFSFGLGMLLWGYLSDIWGRKPCVIFGFSIFIVGCVGCYFSYTIEGLMLSRFVQALGGSVGSVLGQAICRDAFHGAALGKIYATIGGALAIFPAIAPVIGGIIDQNYHWQAIFLFLLGGGFLLIAFIVRFLPETHHEEHRVKNSMREISLKMLGDRYVIGYVLMIGGANGILFSYYAEGPFYMIEMLDLSPSQYGMTLLGVALAYLVGGVLSRHLQHYFDTKKIMDFGLITLFVGTVIFVGIVTNFSHQTVLIWGCIVSMAIILIGQMMVISNAFSLALVLYKNCIGTASSLFGFSYNILVSLFIYGMGWLHNGSAYPMPFYFCAIAIFMIFINKTLLNKNHEYSQSLSNNNTSQPLSYENSNPSRINR